MTSATALASAPETIIVSRLERSANRPQNGLDSRAAAPAASVQPAAVPANTETDLTDAQVEAELAKLRRQEKTAQTAKRPNRPPEKHSGSPCRCATLNTLPMMIV